MRLTDKQVFRIALDDALDWNESLLDALHKDDPHTSVVEHRVKRLKDVRSRYFGEKPDPFKNAELVQIWPPPRT